jgi:hypothetical protein
LWNTARGSRLHGRLAGAPRSVVPAWLTSGAEMSEDAARRIVRRRPNPLLRAGLPLMTLVVVGALGLAQLLQVCGASACAGGRVTRGLAPLCTSNTALTGVCVRARVV